MAVLPPPEARTKPKPRGNIRPEQLVAGRYGTDTMSEIWGPVKTFEYSLLVQGLSAEVLSALHPDILPPEYAAVLKERAQLKVRNPDGLESGYVDPDRIRDLEEKTGHDVIAINKVWEEAVLESEFPEAAASINGMKTSADTTEPAKVLQVRRSVHALAESVENLRDITAERALQWDSIPHLDQTHKKDAVPTVAGRPLVHYVEMLQSDLDFMRFVHDNSIVGKWSDVTGNHHSAVDMGIDGREIEKEFCRRLGVQHMIAAAQVPGREFMTDVYYALARTSETVGNLANYIHELRDTDKDIFRYPKGKKGSGGMPHKDAFGANPIKEEQFRAITNFMRGLMAGAISATRMSYARDLDASLFDRVGLWTGFNLVDHGIREVAGVVYNLILNEERSRERVDRSYGIIVSPRFLAYLTDRRRVANPMPRSEAHDMLGSLATTAYEQQRPYSEVLLESEAVTSRIPKEQILDMADPSKYIGMSREIIHDVYDSFHGKRTFLEAAAVTQLG